MKQDLINALRVGDRIKGYYLLTSITIKTVSNGRVSIMLGVLSDQTGTVGCKIWGYQGPLTSADAGNVVYAEGVIKEYNNALQAELTEFRLADADETSSVADMLTPSAPGDWIDMDRTIQEAIAAISDADYRSICIHLVENYSQEFSRLPAAKSVHHAFLNGLLMHTSNMVRAAQGLAEIYGTFINKDLLMAGTILHDIGKVLEFETSQLGLVSQYSVQGQLMGHLVIGAEIVANMADKLNISADKSMLLQHLLLSHHGTPEFGAAVRPICAEAYLLNIIDTMDAKMETVREQLGKMEPGEVSDIVNFLGTRIYRHQ